MRAPALALAILLLAVLFAPASGAEDFGALDKVNRLIRIRATPQLAPGESGTLSFYFNSTYATPTPISNVWVNASIYQYATIDESVPIDASWLYAYPKIAETGTRNWTWNSL